MFDKIVCSIDSRECMMQRCKNCPAPVILEKNVQDQLVDDNSVAD